MKKFKLYIELKYENMNLIIKDIVDEPFDLKSYISNHYFEKFEIKKFILKGAQK